MKKLFILASLTVMLFIAKPAYGQSKIDSSYANTYYLGRLELFQLLTPPKKAIVFLGNSLTERGPWQELLPGQPVMNRGIGGDNTFGVLARLEELVSCKPKIIFLLIGINDIGRGLPVEVITKNYRRIIQKLQAGTPKTRICIQSVLPLNDSMLTFKYLENKQDSIRQLNAAIKHIAVAYQLDYIDLHSIFANEKGQLKAQYSQDGIHLKPAAYQYWVTYLKQQKFL